MERLYAPWRFQYLSQAPMSQGCFFCAAVRGGEESLTVTVGERALVLLNRFPYTSGHVMVAPIEHVGDVTELGAETLTEMMQLAQRAVKALQAAYNPHGFNLGMNLGEAAGAGVVDHVHLHVVPRWRGDTNFMPVTGEVRVLPEELSQTLTRLREAMEVVDV